MTTRLPKITYNGRLLLEDAASKGLDPRALADRTKGRDRLGLRTVYRFLSGEVQSQRTARILAAVVKKPVSRYVIRQGAEEAVA